MSHHNLATTIMEIAEQAIPVHASEIHRNMLKSLSGVIACRVALRFTNIAELTEEEISVLEDFKDNLHVLSEGDDVSSHRQLIDKLLAGRSTRGRQAEQTR